MQRRYKLIANMTSPARLLFVRHGETDWNVEHRLQGQHTGDNEPSLSATGETQARSLGLQLALAHPTANLIVSSDLKRARQVRRLLEGLCHAVSSLFERVSALVGSHAAPLGKCSKSVVVSTLRMSKCPPKVCE